MESMQHPLLVATISPVTSSPALHRFALHQVSNNHFLQSTTCNTSFLPPVYSNIGNKYKLEWPSTILAIISLFVTLPIYYFYSHGAEIRKGSKFAAEIAKAREEGRGGRPKAAGEKPTLRGQEDA